MASQAVKQRNTISLRGSAQIVSEFFNYAVNSILYQRGIYPQETFQQKKQYGLAMMVTKDDGLLAYLTNVTAQMTDWLERGLLQRLVLVVTSAYSGDVLERWTFEVQTDAAALSGGPAPDKPEKEIQSEIQAIIRQITASITFLPLLEDPCTFDLLVYTSKDSSVPDEWEESDPRYITNATDVKLRSFTTKVHKVDTVVSYRLADA
ncbi:MAG: DNA-binding protein [Monoraphidium minutum]|nr:MAG: DNA-binding protein [Monoraphidium minutum]